ncbi:hypothetical protein [Poritiphilus flavus]|uniref:Uncharacterized protein n=1 Tax=Poritiphilus flavus TaxID=2697053 RepID=A0A6L9EGX5_9FLAO|nr:hypothetical protein [Poritiphilus flavus]NAS13872.1 hypothetical protein [Poritiphilus flavus]
MGAISIYSSAGLILTTLLTLWLFYKASSHKKVIYGVIIWMILVGILGIMGFYQETEVIPPRIVFLLMPGIILVIILFSSKKAKAWIDKLNLKWLTLLHIVRVPVEIILYRMYLAGSIPVLMTFEGYNYDILSGITAPAIYYFVFVNKKLGRKSLLIWNFICLALLLNILTIAALSAETPFQKLAFDQPNVGVTQFPFVWLPAIIVPLVLFSHLASIWQLTVRKS